MKFCRSGTAGGVGAAGAALEGVREPEEVPELVGERLLVEHPRRGGDPGAALDVRDEHHATGLREPAERSTGGFVGEAIDDGDGHDARRGGADDLRANGLVAAGELERRVGEVLHVDLDEGEARAHSKDGAHAVHDGLHVFERSHERPAALADVERVRDGELGPVGR